MDKVKIELIKKCIEDADKLQSTHGVETYDVPALSSLKLRHLMNNIGALGTHYLDCGPHRGGLFCATVRGNKNLLSATAVDSFESDMDAIEPAKPDFLVNAKIHLPKKTKFSILIGDCFSIDLKEIKNKIDLFLYDCGHSRLDQEMALTYYKPVLADTFIYCCDDWQYGEVKQGTMDGIKKGGYEILFERELLNPDGYTEDQHLNEYWWRGYAVFLLKKKK